MTMSTMETTTLNLTSVDANWYSCLATSRFKYSYFAVIVFATVTTLVGNPLILLSLTKYKSSFKANIYILIGNLAVSDLLLGCGLLLCVMEFFVKELVREKHFCLIRMSIIMVALVCSGCTLVLISVDRFFAVVSPIQHLIKFTRYKFKVAVTLTWVFSILYGIIPLYGINNFGEGGYRICLQSTAFTKELILMNNFLIIVIFLTVTVLYTIIGFNLVRNHYKVKNTIKASHVGHKRNQNVTSPKNENETLQITGRRSKGVIKTIVMLIVCVMFTFCWLPVTVVTTRNAFKQDATKHDCKEEFSILMGFINSGLNWIIYGVVDMKFRSSFMAIFRLRTFVYRDHATSS